MSEFRVFLSVLVEAEDVDTARYLGAIKIQDADLPELEGLVYDAYENETDE